MTSQRQHGRIDKDVRYRRARLLFPYGFLARAFGSDPVAVSVLRSHSNLVITVPGRRKISYSGAHAALTLPRPYYDDIREGEFVLARTKLFDMPAIIVHGCLMDFHQTFG